MQKDERLYVSAAFIDPQTGEGSTGTVAFGWDEAQVKAKELRQWGQDELGVKCHVEINPDKPDRRRASFHGL